MFISRSIAPTRLLVINCFCLGILILVGCGGGADLPPEMHSVSGTLTHNGDPVTGVYVNFMVEGKRPSSGIVDENGKFTMSYTATTEGVVAGENIVSLTQISPNPDDPPPSATLQALLDKYGDGVSKLKVTIDKDHDNFLLELQ